MSEEKKETAIESNTRENQIVLARPRLPYHPAIKERFGYDKSDWKALVEAIYPVAQTPESVILALSYCKARKLDPFKRCIHIVPIWDSAKGRNVDTIWPGIGELRTTAHRTNCYAGRDKTEFGPDIDKVWEGKTKGKFAKAFKITVKFPEWAQVTVYRFMNKERVAFAGPQVYWIETFGKNSGGGPNSMWENRPRGQIDKCAEAAALRAAFPEEVGNEYIQAEAHYPQARRVDSVATYTDAKELTDAANAADSGSEQTDVADPAETEEEAKVKAEAEAKEAAQKKAAAKKKDKADKAKKAAAAYAAKQEAAAKAKADAKPGDIDYDSLRYTCNVCTDMVDKKKKFKFPEPGKTGPEDKPCCPKCYSMNIEDSQAFDGGGA